MSGRTRCAECGYPIWPGQPVVTVLYGDQVHLRCRDGIPADINPSRRVAEGDEVGGIGE